MTDLEIKLEKLLNDHYSNLEEIDKFIFGTTLTYAFFQDKYEEMLKQFNETDDGMSLFKKLKNNIPKYENDVKEFGLINFIARTEAFLNDLVEILFIWKKESLISDKKVSYKQVIKSSNINELIKQIRDDEILQFSHSSFEEKMKVFRSKFNIDLSEIEKHKIKIIEIFTTRNLLLHNNGLVNETYLKYNKGSSFNLGDKRVIDNDYISKTKLLLMILAKSIGEKVTSKIKE